MTSYTRSPKQVTVHCPRCGRVKTVWEDINLKMPAAVRAYVWMQRHVRNNHPKLEVVK